MLDYNIVDKVVEQISQLEKDTEFQIKKYLKPYHLDNRADAMRYAMAIINRLKGKIKISKRYINAVIDVPYVAYFRRG